MTVIKAIHWRKDSSFQSGTGTIGHSYAKKSRLKPYTVYKNKFRVGHGANCKMKHFKTVGR